MNAIQRRRRALAAALLTAVLVLGGSLAAGPAYADDYPTWDDVVAAQGSEASKQAQVANIQGLIATLKADTAAAQALSVKRGAEYQDAQDAFDTAAFKADELKARADAAQATADASSKQAGQLAALMARSGGTGLSLNLLVSESAAIDGLLYRLGAMSQLTGSTTRVYEQAEQHTNAAKSLTAQAVVAADALHQLADEAATLRDQAIEAQAALEASLAAQETHEVELAAQLKVLSENRAATEVDYQAGVAYRAEQARIAEEQARLAREAAAGAAAAAAAAAQQAADDAAAAGESPPVSSGWASPFPYSHSTDEFGMRVNPVSGNYLLHAGLDLGYNGGTCGANVFAAASGQVSYAGWSGGYGNLVTIDNGGGISTAYGHNVQLLVSPGEWVGAGQVISYAGTTGNSTGCHLHFEVRDGGRAIDPRGYMADRGVFFG